LRAGVLGGTFDPIHLGHLRSAEEICQELDLERVYLIPSAAPPHKAGDPVSRFHHRLAMVRLAVSDSPLLGVLDLEARRPGLSYSIETLKELHRTFSPDPQLFFILGMDAFLEIKTWKDYTALFEYAHFVVIHRPGFSAGELEPFLLSLGLEIQKARHPGTFSTASGMNLFLMAPTLMDISSTRIRRMVKEGRSIRFLVPDPVMNYIAEEGLYKNHAGPR
jgi:nicotinate-nucleotide adenylyltransferase